MTFSQRGRVSNDSLEDKGIHRVEHLNDNEDREETVEPALAISFENISQPISGNRRSSGGNGRAGRRRSGVPPSRT